MTDTASTPFAVIGATGQQGGQVVDALLARSVPVRAVVRDPSSDRSRSLADRGVELAVADQEDAASLTAALRDVAGVYAMTTFAGPDATEGEIRRGAIIAEAVMAAAVPRVVYSSVGGAERHTGIPHFESKRRTEERLESYTPARFLRPAFFMDNLRDQIAGMSDGDATLRFPMAGDVPVQMIAVRDIGRAGAALLLDPDALDGRSIEIAGDELTLETAAELIGRRLGRPVGFEQLPIDVLGGDEDLIAMFRWFGRLPAYQADVAETRRLVPDVLDFAGWLETLPDPAS